MELAVDSFGTPEFGVAMAEMEARAADPHAAFEEIAREFPNIERAAFGGTPSLIDTGELFGSLVGSPATSVSASELSIGTDVAHAVFWWKELLAPVEKVGERWAEAVGGYVVEGEARSSLFGVVGA